VTTVGLYTIGTSTTLASNKSLRALLSHHDSGLIYSGDGQTPAPPGGVRRERRHGRPGPEGRYWATLRRCASSVVAKTWPPVPLATK
jgi:hypothetical protein